MSLHSNVVRTTLLLTLGVLLASVTGCATSRSTCSFGVVTKRILVGVTCEINWR